MIKDEALRLALEALESVGSFNPEIWDEVDRAKAALREALADQPEQVMSRPEHFIKLVAQHEREACAKVCENLDAWNMDDPASTAADAIRARGKP